MANFYTSIYIYIYIYITSPIKDDVYLGTDSLKAPLKSKVSRLCAAVRPAGPGGALLFSSAGPARGAGGVRLGAPIMLINIIAAPILHHAYP